jgi:hypothetical protein
MVGEGQTEKMRKHVWMRGCTTRMITRAWSRPAFCRRKPRLRYRQRTMDSSYRPQMSAPERDERCDMQSTCRMPPSKHSRPEAGGTHSDTEAYRYVQIPHQKILLAWPAIYLLHREPGQAVVTLRLALILRSPAAA